MLFRFVAGGLFVSGFAIIGNLFKPKSFAGLFAAAPSLALATLALTIGNDGVAYATVEARYMLAGAVAFFLYARLTMIVLSRYKITAKRVTSVLLVLWLQIAITIWLVASRVHL
jgi:hypothetical protein